MLARLRSIAAALLGRDRFEQEMTDELQFHIDAYAADLERAGVPRAEARRRARIEFGIVDNVKQDARQSRGLRYLDETWQDLRYAIRLMRQTPGFTAAAIVSLGLGIGANTAIFSLIDAVMLRILPVSDPHELYFLAHGSVAVPSTSSNYPLYDRYRQATVFSGVTAYRATDLKVHSGESIDLVAATNFTGHPGLTFRVGYTDSPTRAILGTVPDPSGPKSRVTQNIAMHGRLFEEGKMLALARVLESHFDVWRGRPPVD